MSNSQFLKKIFI